MFLVSLFFLYGRPTEQPTCLSQWRWHDCSLQQQALFFFLFPLCVCACVCYG